MPSSSARTAVRRGERRRRKRRGSGSRGQFQKFTSVHFFLSFHFSILCRETSLPLLSYATAVTATTVTISNRQSVCQLRDLNFPTADGKTGAFFPLAMEKLPLPSVDYPECRTGLLYRGRQQMIVDGILTVPVERFLKEIIPNHPLPDANWSSSPTT